MNAQAYLEKKNDTMGENSFMKKILRKSLNQKGLTLIELLAVIVILAIVAAIAVPAIGNIIENSRIKAAKSDAAMILNAANLADTENSALIGSTAGPVPAGFLESQGNFTNYTVSQANENAPILLSGTWENGVELEFYSVSLNDIDTNVTNDILTTGTAAGTIVRQ